MYTAKASVISVRFFFSSVKETVLQSTKGFRFCNGSNFDHISIAAESPYVRTALPSACDSDSVLVRKIILVVVLVFVRSRSGK